MVGLENTVMYLSTDGREYFYPMNTY